MSGRASEPEKLLTPSEVAALFRVDPKTVTRWAKAGKLNSIRTLGGHRRYRAAEVYALLDQVPGGQATSAPAQRQPGSTAGGKTAAPQQRTASVQHLNSAAARRSTQQPRRTQDPARETRDEREMPRTIALP